MSHMPIPSSKEGWATMYSLKILDKTTKREKGKWVLEANSNLHTKKTCDMILEWSNVIVLTMPW